MAQVQSFADFKPALDHIKFDGEGGPYVEGLRCRGCQAAVLSPRLACPACGARQGFDAFRASHTGQVQAYSIVKRSYPGIETPFISAVVQLSDGLVLKANLYGTPFEPEAITPQMPVKLVFTDALGRKDQTGACYVAYGFEPLRPQSERS